MKRDWLQIFTNLAVVIGIGILIYEINQNKQLVDAQLSYDTWTMYHGELVAMMGETPERSLAKLLTSPDDLSQEDIIVLDKYLTAQFARWRMLQGLQLTGEFGRDWTPAVARDSVRFLNSPFGRQWWEQNRVSANPEMRSVIDTALGDPPVANYIDYYKELGNFGDH